MHTPTEPQVGRFRYNQPDGRWWWSDEMFQIHGMEPGAVLPTLDVLERHVHPDDRDRVRTALDSPAQPGEPAAVQYRLLQLTGDEHVVTMTAGPSLGDEQIEGVVVDVTRAMQDVIASRVNAELNQALSSHATIDQAKGIFMLGYGIDEAAAFELLRWSSQQRNVRLLTLAERVISAVGASGGLGPEMRQRLDDYFFSSIFADRPLSAAPGSQLATRFSTSGDAPTLSVAGPVDLATAGEFAAALTELARRAPDAGTVVVDLRGADHVGSAGVSALSAAQRRCRANGVRMRVVLGAESRLAVAGHGLDVLEDEPSAVRSR
ncbi:ANTAR domain-containing protein [Cellulomonas edaphi]|uniref:ANTAR domain-containing protein n=1 Tax=Cellulomonas edaphi TaxID=3053468 RepID=A0ABT7S7J9_9CELL|nr:ANTAR domain-containing protein [Cellulomons edaphi]MDM7831603.1 ANTAR domain-containing protein [Cellulomons edaphi]